jgi:hypothetical protein
VENILLPLFDELRFAYHLHSTSGPRAAFERAKVIFNDNERSTEPMKIIIAGGDGTTQEVLDGAVHSVTGLRKLIQREWQLIILPMGTVGGDTTLCCQMMLTCDQANALYHSLAPDTPPTISPELEALLPRDPTNRNKLSSFIASICPTRTPVKIPLTITNMRSNSGTATEESLFPSHVVWSTSLHANLLSEAEALREKYPGVERFQHAAQKVLSDIYYARVRLLPPPWKSITQYDPKTQSFVEPFTLGEGDMLDGPFSYFLATTICDRLEPTFVVNPTIKCIPSDPDTPSMDLVVIRPRRDTAQKPEIEVETRQDLWGKRIMEILQHAYKEGQHIDLTYPEDGGPTRIKGDGPVAVEVFRVGGFEWTPLVSDCTLIRPELVLTSRITRIPQR